MLLECLNAVDAMNISDYETIVVDNGSHDGTLEAIRESYPSVTPVALNTNTGFSFANNVGIRASRGEYIALLNNDTLVQPGWLGEMVKSLEELPDYGLCASKILMMERPNIADACGDFFSVEGVAGKIGHGEVISNNDVPKPVFGASAGAVLYRRSMLEDIGLFDEDFFITHEDTDLSFRAQLMGYRCMYVPNAVAYHHVGATIGIGSDAAAYYTLRNSELTYFKNMPDRLLWRFFHLHLLTNLLLLVAYSVRGQALTFARAKLHAMQMMQRTIQKRRNIQRNRRVSDEYLESVLTHGWLASKVKERISGLRS